MRYKHLQILALLALNEAVVAQRHNGGDPSGHPQSSPSSSNSIIHVVEPISFITGVPAPTIQHSSIPHEHSAQHTDTVERPSHFLKGVVLDPSYTHHEAHPESTGAVEHPSHFLTSAVLNPSYAYDAHPEHTDSAQHPSHFITGAVLDPSYTHGGRPEHTPTASLATSSSSPVPTAGIEYIEIASISTRVGAKRQGGAAVVTVPVSVAVCPIPSAQVADTPCYPCVVGEPQGQQTLRVHTTSVVNAAPDPTPIFWYQFCTGCRGTLVTTPVPGYTAVADSRNIGTCLLVPAESTSMASFVPRPTDSGRPSGSARPSGSGTRRPNPSGSASGSGRPTGSGTRKPNPSGSASRNPTGSKPTSKATATSKKTSTAAVPATTAAPGITTTAYVTATITYLLQVITTCTSNGAVSTVYQQSTTCSTYNTVVVIPASLCVTVVTTAPGGSVATVTTPVSTWTQILTTQATSSAAAVTASAAPAGYTPVQTAVSSAGAVGATPTVYVKSGAGRAATTSFFTVGFSLVAFFLVVL